MKHVIIIVSLFLTACATTDQPRDTCADRPVYKPYTIEVPKRPVLSSSGKFGSEGELVRAVEDDMSKLSEYAEKLENLIFSLPTNLSVPK